jgi:hypothetical protein
VKFQLINKADGGFALKGMCNGASFVLSGVRGNPRRFGALSQMFVSVIGAREHMRVADGQMQREMTDTLDCNDFGTLHFTPKFFKAGEKYHHRAVAPAEAVLDYNGHLRIVEFDKRYDVDFRKIRMNEDYEAFGALLA